jgi:hypothetical protein
MMIERLQDNDEIKDSFYSMKSDRSSLGNQEGKQFTSHMMMN